MLRQKKIFWQQKFLFKKKKSKIYRNIYKIYDISKKNKKKWVYDPLNSNSKFKKIFFFEFIFFILGFNNL